LSNSRNIEKLTEEYLRTGILSLPRKVLTSPAQPHHFALA